ncbi:type I secretion system permease/ATPase [Caulobacter sp. S45]|uniref:type I secretion system permease/ATPase n=1 Tax=Caulobacter sp. S45 TaxID=1641861 RepID=UPI0015770736|nr:type I secretion system permease/ATPase [Caulobacter sp. S45]
MTHDGAQAFALAASLCDTPVEADELARRFADARGFGETAMLRAARAVGLKAQVVRPKAARLGKTPLPAVAWDLDGRPFVLARAAIDAKDEVEKLLVQYPGEPPAVLSRQEFLSRWTGALLLLARRRALGDVAGQFGIGWFFDAVLRYRRILGEVLLISFALQLVALATPLFFQVVVDKVLVHQGTSTLEVIAVGLGLSMVFEVLLGGLRSYIFSHTTNRIDVELGARLFDHLTHLPLAYFGARRVGDSVARVRELENIRSFLTGSTLTLVIDLVFAVLVLGVIYVYSVPLGLIVTGAIPIYGAISVLATPELRLRINEKFRRGAENQAFLVETITGIETVKAMAVEPNVQRKWEEQLAGYVRAAFRVTTLGVFASQSAQFVSRATTLLILYVGAILVIHEKLTVGELIAVNMLSGQISSPVLRLAQLWQDFQQVKISVDRVGDIMNTVAEPSRPPNSAARPAVRGEITFENVGFRYAPDLPRAVSELSVRVPPGQILGVVGPSGSGKSTLAKLLQRLHAPEVGRVLIDGVDLSMVDPAWLRRQVGVVLQESILFNASIRDNIALADPTLSMDKVIAAAKLAGAHEFITAAPGGYDTHVGERGSTLSGGQRQRIAIARSLVMDPPILILDEATSALDLESEQAIQVNMAAISRGRTVIIVAHRLSAIRSAHRIITIDAGRVVEDGAPLELLRAGGRFSRLYAAQNLSFTEPARAPA